MWKARPCSVKKRIVTKPKEVKTRCSLAESSKEGCLTNDKMIEKLFPEFKNE
jgi:hypothetical protein